MSEKFRRAANDVRAAFRVVREKSRDHVILKQEGPRFYASSPNARGLQLRGLLFQKPVVKDRLNSPDEDAVIPLFLQSVLGPGLSSLSSVSFTGLLGSLWSTVDILDVPCDSALGPPHPGQVDCVYRLFLSSPRWGFYGRQRFLDQERDRAQIALAQSQERLERSAREIPRASFGAFRHEIS